MSIIVKIMAQDNKGYRLIVLEGQPDITFGVKDDMGIPFMLLKPTYGVDRRTVSEEKIFLEGDVYIMNEDGKNISKFEVSAKPPLEMSQELKGMLTKTRAVYAEPQVFTQTDGRVVFNGLGNPILIFHKGTPIESSPSPQAMANVTPLFVSNMPIQNPKDMTVVYKGSIVLLQNLPIDVCSRHTLWCTPEVCTVIAREKIWDLENINVIYDEEILDFIHKASLKQQSALLPVSVEERIMSMLMRNFVNENFKAIQGATHQSPEDYLRYEHDVVARDENGRVIFDDRGNAVIKHKKGDVILDRVVSIQPMQQKPISR